MDEQNTMPQGDDAQKPVMPPMDGEQAAPAESTEMAPEGEAPATA